MAKSNVGKFKVYADGQRLYGPAGTGQNLNTDLEAALANEIDAFVADIVGDLVIGLVVSASTGLAASVAAGGGYIQGQRVVLSAPAIVGSLPPSTAGIKIYIEAGTPWNAGLRGWPAAVGFTVGSLAEGQYLLATVTTGISGVTLVLDQRILADGLASIGITVDDTATPAATAQSVQRRLNHFAARIRAIIGGASWLDAVPATLGSLATAVAGLVASLASLVSEFDAHAHTGVGGDAPKIAAANVTSSPTGGIAATNVNAAIAELEAEKLSLAGGTMTGAITLPGNPASALQAVPKQYVDAISTAWAGGLGTPVYASVSTFTVTGDQSAHYYPGRVLRYKDTAGGATYQYTMVKSYTVPGGVQTITVVDGALDAGLSGVQLANFGPTKLTFACTGRLPSGGADGLNLAGRLLMPELFEPLAISFYVEKMASTNGASAGNTTVRLRRGTDPAADGATDVLAAVNLAYNAKESLWNNPVHTEVGVDQYLQVDVTAMPNTAAADDLFLILLGVPRWAKNL